MQQTLTEVIDASAAATIMRNIVLTGSYYDDELAALITLISTDWVPNDELKIDVLLAGLAGNDTLSTTINLDNENTWDVWIPAETITSSIDGGTGDDSITGTINLGYRWGIISNSAGGGDGNDNILLTTTYGVDYYDSDWGRSVASSADGGAGNDTIEIRTIMGENGSTWEPLSHVIHGGSGSDRITSYVKATSNDGDSANVTIFGDKGADTINAYMQLDEGYSQGVTEIHGGAGNDVILSEVANYIFPDEVYTIDASLFGDGGKDRITSRLHMDEWYEDTNFPEFHITLTGGGGADTLISEGGNENNHNTFDGGSGNDKMYGDGSVDEFLFLSNVNQGFDQINNWDGSIDQLNVSGLSNAQIDAQSSIASVGADVVLTMDSGTVITFKNVGLAGVDSVDDLFWLAV